MALKRPVTLAQARQWPAAAKRRESFCARMGGMRKKLTSQDAAGDPGSPINLALAAWDCDKPEGLRREHVSKGIRMARGITPAMVGSKARKNPAEDSKSVIGFAGGPIDWVLNPEPGASPYVLIVSGRENKKAADAFASRALSGDWVLFRSYNFDGDAKAARDDLIRQMQVFRAQRQREGNPARKASTKVNPSAMLYTVHSAGSDGKPRDAIAHFRKRADALAYAKAYAKSYGVPVALTGKKL